MYSFHIDAMAHAVLDALPPQDVDDPYTRIHEALEKYWQDMIADTWTVADVQWIAQENGTTVTKEQARIILRKVLDKMNAEVGINWDVLWYWTEEELR
jgi:hypothetical protein